MCGGGRQGKHSIGQAFEELVLKVERLSVPQLCKQRLAECGRPEQGSHLILLLELGQRGINSG